MVTVLSCFDGISCGQVALRRAGIPVEAYYASEINRFAVQVTQHHFPKTIQLGDVRMVKSSRLPKIDLLLGGSPCQGFSYSGKRLNFNDSRSRLFFQFARLLDELKPTYWLLENVSMKPEFAAVITEWVGAPPVCIDSALVSGQMRRRLYWANFPIEQPEDRGITLHDCLDPGSEHLNKAALVGRRITPSGTRDDSDTSIKTMQYLEVRQVNQIKSNCLTTAPKDTVLSPLPPGRYINGFQQPFRYYSVAEIERLQTLPEGYVGNHVSSNQARKLIGNAWTVDVIAHILSQIPNNKPLTASPARGTHDNVR